MKNRSNYLNQAKYAKKLRTMLLYIGLFVLWILVEAFVQNPVIFVGGLLMAGITFLVLKFIPNDRENTLKAFKGAFAGHTLYLLMMYLLLYVGLHADQAQNGTTALSYINGLFQFSIYLVPIGYVGWQAKKFLGLMGIGKSKRDSIDYYKDHGNDGLM